MKVFKRGAEAEIFLSGDVISKKRCKKDYRHIQIDEKIRFFRTKREIKILNMLNKNKVCVPKILKVDIENFSFDMEYIRGCVLKDSLTVKNLKIVFNQIIKMHNLDVIHGDLTTLNMILKGEKVYLIDFGLSEVSKNIEKKAVDLNVFFICLKALHNDFFHLKEKLLKDYQKKTTDGNLTILRLEKVELRGRNKAKL